MTPDERNETLLQLLEILMRSADTARRRECFGELPAIANTALAVIQELPEKA